VPFDAILVNIVEDAQARFWSLVDVEFCVVGLGSPCVSLVTPGLLNPTWRSRVGWCSFGIRVGPEPSQDWKRVEIFSGFTSFEIAETTGCPDVFEISICEEFDHHVVLSFAFDSNAVHASLSAFVSGFQPIDLRLDSLSCLGINFGFLVPREVVVVSSELPLFWSISAEIWFWEGQESSRVFVILLGWFWCCWTRSGSNWRSGLWSDLLSWCTVLNYSSTLVSACLTTDAKVVLSRRLLVCELLSTLSVHKSALRSSSRV